MGTYVATARTNYFRVHDKEAFTAEIDRAFPNWGHKVAEGDGNNPQGSVAVIDQDGYGWPTYACDEYDDTGEDPDETTLLDIIQSHVIDGDVAVMQECGHEKSRYVNGHAVAVNSRGETATVALDDIYAKATALGHTVTAAAH